MFRRMLAFLRRRPDPSFAFIVGCGRSGTTILGRLLGAHPDVLYLDEPRGLWERCYPETDIWSGRASERGGRLVLTERDVRPEASRRLRRKFAKRAHEAGASAVVEKVPENAFRMAFIRAIFPEARFIAIRRRTEDVAASIARLERLPKPWRWYGEGDYKWRQLLQIAGRDADTDDVYERGLLEHRLTYEAVSAFGDSSPDAPLARVSYEDLTLFPFEELRRLQTFIGLKPHEAVVSLAAKEIRVNQPEGRLSPSEGTPAVTGASVP